MVIEMIRKMVIATAILVTFANVAMAQRSTADLEKHRLAFREREENLVKVRDNLKERIDRMKAKLDIREKQLEAVNVHLDQTRQSILETEKAIQDRVNNKVW